MTPIPYYQNQLFSVARGGETKSDLSRSEDDRGFTLVGPFLVGAHATGLISVLKHTTIQHNAEPASGYKEQSVHTFGGGGATCQRASAHAAAAMREGAVAEAALSLHACQQHRGLRQHCHTKIPIWDHNHDLGSDHIATTQKPIRISQQRKHENIGDVRARGTFLCFAMGFHTFFGPTSPSPKTIHLHRTRLPILVCGAIRHVHTVRQGTNGNSGIAGLAART